MPTLISVAIVFLVLLLGIIILGITMSVTPSGDDTSTKERTNRRSWLLRFSVAVMVFDIILFLLWITSTLDYIGDPTATVLMRIGQGLSVIGAVTSLVCLLKRWSPLWATSSSAVSVLAFGWLGISFWIGSM